MDPVSHTVSAEIDAPVVFVGYGVTAPEYGWDDYAGIDVKGKVVRTLDPGMILYPTGNTDGAWREVTDEVDNKGWVPNGSLSMAR